MPREIPDTIIFPTPKTKQETDLYITLQNYATAMAAALNSDFVLEVRSGSDPDSPVEGQIWYRSD